MITKEEFQKQMLDADYKNFDNEDVVLIAYNMYIFILEQFESFKIDLGIKYSDSSINQDYLIEMRKTYSIFTRRIQNLNKEQLKGFSHELKTKFPDFEKELTYYNTLQIINYYVFDYENWQKTEKTLFD
jgi:hypothetical protein